MNNDEIKSLLGKVADYLNKNYYQSSENYEKIICTDATNVFPLFNNRCIVSTWLCGAIVSIEKQVFFISEDDGFWFTLNLKKDNAYEYVGSKGGGASALHLNSIARAMKDLSNYIESMENIPDYTYWTIDKFKELPRNSDWKNQNIGEVSNIIILPCDSYHDSGFRNMEFVIIGDNNKPICRVGGGSDVVHFENLPRDINIDCLPTSGLLRLWGRTNMRIGIDLSTMNIKF